MLQPKKRKFRKDFRGRMRGVSVRGSSLAFGEFGIKALERAWITSAQIEAARRAITHRIKRGGKMWIRIFPDKPVTARPAGQRMGSGKGEISHYVAVVTPGRILFEVAGLEKEPVFKAFSRAMAKLPIKTKIIAKEE
jgi:large subunit ribosomal protein L16